MRAEINRAIDADVNAMRGLLAALVSVPTENPPGRCYRECVVLIEAALASLGIEHQRVQIPAADPPRDAVFAWIGEPGPTLYFHGHYDVVPAASPEQFAPRIDGDALFGRGTSDMKGGLVAMLYAAKAFRDVARNPHGRLGLVFVPDEEAGGAAGSGALASAGLLARDAIGMLLPEPTSGVIWNTNRGALSLEVAVRGRAAHVGLQHRGVNAFERAVVIVNRLLALKQEVDRAHSVLLIGGRVEAGTNFNLVPDECRFTIDRRMNPEEDFEAEKDRVLAILNGARNAGIELEVR